MESCRSAVGQSEPCGFVDVARLYVDVEEFLRREVSAVVFREVVGEVLPCQADAGLADFGAEVVHCLCECGELSVVVFLCRVACAAVGLEHAVVGVGLGCEGCAELLHFQLEVFQRVEFVPHILQ
ncbi:MAG: hypothetical protein ACI3Z7_01440 [Candidatus Aphodosoma sp.]